MNSTPQTLMKYRPAKLHSLYVFSEKMPRPTIFVLWHLNAVYFHVCVTRVGWLIYNETIYVICVFSATTMEVCGKNTVDNMLSISIGFSGKLSRIQYMHVFFYCLKCFLLQYEIQTSSTLTYQSIHTFKRNQYFCTITYLQ